MGHVRPHLRWTVFLIAIILAALLPLHLNNSRAEPISDGLMQATPTTFSGDLGTCDPTYQRAFNTGTLSITGSNVFYEFQTFTIDLTGVYTLNMSGTSIPDGHASIYQNAFNPSSALTNLIFVDDDSGTGTNPAFLNITLNAGVTYILVTTTLTNGMTGSYTWTLTGAGAYTLGANSITLDCSTATPTSTPSSTATPTDTSTSTVSPSPTSTPTDTATPSPTSTSSGTSTPTDTPTPSPTSTLSGTPTVTSTPTDTATPSPTSTLSGTSTPTDTATPSPTSTSSDEPTATDASSVTATASATSPPSEPLCTVPLPVGSVQGRLLTLTQGLFSPDPRSTTDVLLPAGSSWWIIDTAPGYYRLWIACEATPIWVSSFLVTPNYDAIWHGSPLP